MRAGAFAEWQDTETCENVTENKHAVNPGGAQNLLAPCELDQRQ